MIFWANRKRLLFRVAADIKIALLKQDIQEHSLLLDEVFRVEIAWGIVR